MTTRKPVWLSSNNFDIFSSESLRELFHEFCFIISRNRNGHFFHFNITGFSGLEILRELIVMGNFEK